MPRQTHAQAPPCVTSMSLLSRCQNFGEAQLLMFSFTSNRSIATSNKGITASSQKLLVTRASLLVIVSFVFFFIFFHGSLFGPLDLLGHGLAVLGQGGVFGLCAMLGRSTNKSVSLVCAGLVDQGA